MRRAFALSFALYGLLYFAAMYGPQVVVQLGVVRRSPPECGRHGRSAPRFSLLGSPPPRRPAAVSRMAFISRCFRLLPPRRAAPSSPGPSSTSRRAPRRRRRSPPPPASRRCAAARPGPPAHARAPQARPPPPPCQTAPACHTPNLSPPLSRLPERTQTHPDAHPAHSGTSSRCSTSRSPSPSSSTAPTSAGRCASASASPATSLRITCAGSSAGCAPCAKRPARSRTTTSRPGAHRGAATPPPYIPTRPNRPLARASHPRAL